MLEWLISGPLDVFGLFIPFGLPSSIKLGVCQDKCLKSEGNAPRQCQYISIRQYQTISNNVKHTVHDPCKLCFFFIDGGRRQSP